jgi:trehalose/maltose hydrolase-like predicted phosphorylase
MIHSWVLVSANLRKTAEEKPMKRQSIDKDQVEPNEKEGMHSSARAAPGR